MGRDDLAAADLAGLICARLCHDLGSPVGAVVNGVDLLREIGGAEGEELDMLDRSARRAAALLRFHRTAFGAVRDPEARVSRADLVDRAREVLGGPRVEVVCAAPGGPPVSLAAARLAGLMLLAGRAALGMSGTLRLLLPAEGDLPVAVMAEGPAAGLSDDQRRWLEGGGGPGPDAPEVEFALIPPAAAAIGARIESIVGDGQVALRALPA